MRAQALSNSKMPAGNKREFLTHTWSNKRVIINDDIYRSPAEVINMQMYRSMLGRKEDWALEPDDYHNLKVFLGRMPIVVMLGDFLQLKPPRQLSLVDDLVEKARDGVDVSIEAQNACRAFDGIDSVIEKKSED